MKNSVTFGLPRRSFASGKVFGRRQTFWDTLYSACFASGENHSVAGLVVQAIIAGMINFTCGACLQWGGRTLFPIESRIYYLSCLWWQIAGLTVSIFVYAAQLPSMLMSFQPSLLSGTLFFLVALLGAVAIVAVCCLNRSCCPVFCEFASLRCMRLSTAMAILPVCMLRRDFLRSCFALVLR